MSSELPRLDRFDGLGRAARRTAVGFGLDYRNLHYVAVMKHEKG
jgi:hypothetical protein